MWFERERETEIATVGGVVFVRDAAHGERPVFKRTYTATVGAGDRLAKISVDAMWSFGRRYIAYGTLTQLNGKYVLFDLDAVADKILDRSLAAEVQAVANEILRLDKAFVNDEPKTFVDEARRTWTRE